MNRCSFFFRYEGEATRLTFAKATSAWYGSLTTEEEMGQCKKKKGGGWGWGALFDVCQGSLEQRDDRTNAHTSAPLLAA